MGCSHSPLNSLVDMIQLTASASQAQEQSHCSLEGRRGPVRVHSHKASVIFNYILLSRGKQAISVAAGTTSKARGRIANQQSDSIATIVVISSLSISFLP